MSRKKSRRRPGDGAVRQPTTDASGEVAAAPPATEDAAARADRREQQKREWAERKRKEDRQARSNAPYIWGGGIAAVIALAVVGGVLLLSGGGDDDAGPTPTVREDPRVAGLPIDVTLTVNMNDDGQNVDPRYEPNQITAAAGQVIEIIAPNIGSVAHNLRLAGVNGEYEAGDPRSDDWVTTPESVDAGEEGRVVVKLDEPGRYPFKCDFHPTQVGVLILS